jgi:hypothetical protein
MTGPTLPYDSFTADMAQRLFHMWQQSDCGIHNNHGKQSFRLPQRPVSVMTVLAAILWAAVGDLLDMFDFDRK